MFLLSNLSFFIYHKFLWVHMGPYGPQPGPGPHKNPDNVLSGSAVLFCADNTKIPETRDFAKKHNRSPSQGEKPDMPDAESVSSRQRTRTRTFLDPGALGCNTSRFSRNDDFTK